VRIRIVFNLLNKGGYVPFHHQYLLAQLIKGVILKGGDTRFSNYSGYNFSGLKGQIQISRRGLHYYSNKITLVFSCSDADFMDYFLDNLFELGDFEIGNLVLSPAMIEKEEPIIFSDKVKYVCISPIIVRKPVFHDPMSKSFINPEEDLFSDLLYETTMERIERQEIYAVKQINTFYRFQIVPDRNYLGKLMYQNKKFARIYPVLEHDAKFEVRGYTFPFTLYADAKVQEFVFTHGLGSFTHKGFGMIDIANADPIKRIIARKSKALA